MPVHVIWNHLFDLPLPVVEKIVRPALIYAFLVLALRIFGKRELAQLNPFDLVVLLCLSNTVQNAIIGEDNSLWGGVIGALSLMTINYLTVRFLFRHRRLDQWLEGKPTRLIIDGKIQKKALAKELMTHSELLAVAHRQGFDSLTEVRDCTLEPGGTFYFSRCTPEVDQVRHDAIIAKLDELQREVAALRSTPR